MWGVLGSSQGVGGGTLCPERDPEFEQTSLCSVGIFEWQKEQLPRLPGPFLGVWGKCRLGRARGTGEGPRGSPHRAVVARREVGQAAGRAALAEAEGDPQRPWQGAWQDSVAGCGGCPDRTVLRPQPPHEASCAPPPAGQGSCWTSRTGFCPPTRRPVCSSPDWLLAGPALLGAHRVWAAAPARGTGGCPGLSSRTGDWAALVDNKTHPPAHSPSLGGGAGGG